MPVFLSQRNTSQRELMDEPECSLPELENTYRQFSTINALISQWRRIYKRRIRPRLHQNKPTSLIDIGFGGGDIPIKLAKWAKQDGLKLRIKAIDTDERAIAYVNKFETDPSITFQQAHTADLDPQLQQFDFVISNHLLHHLNGRQRSELLKSSKRLSTKAVIFNDIRRSDVAYLFFSLFSSLITRNSFIRNDGLISIRRSYTFEELVAKVPDDWKVERLFPFRLLLTYRHE